MKFSAFLPLLLFFQSFWMFGQPAAEELLVPQNDFENQLFSSLAKGDTSHMGLLLAASGRVDSNLYVAYLAQLDQVLLLLDSAKLRKKSPKKQVKKIFESVHDELLRKYEQENQFVEIFETGNYNCVCATAVYCFMLHGLGIPFTVVESPNHVYAVAFVEDERWVMESTDPQQGYYEIDEDLYEAQLEQLIAQKLITRQQAQSEKIDSILQALFPSRPVTTADLVSFQYMNQAMYDYEKSDNFQVFQNALKGFLISRNANQGQLFNESIGVWLGENDYDHPIFYKAVAYYLSTDTMQQQPEFVKSSFLYYGNQWLSDSLTGEGYDAMLEAYKLGFASNESMKKELEMMYFLVHAEKFGEERAFEKAFRSTAKALARFRHEDAVSYALGNLHQLRSQEIWSAKQAVDTMFALHSAFPEIQSFTEWNSYYAELLLREIYVLLDEKKFKTVAQRRAEFEGIMENENLDKLVSSQMIGMIYSRLALHDYNTSKAIAAKTIQRGFKYAPNSTELRRFKEMLRL